MKHETTIPRILRFRARGRVDPDPLRRILTEGRGLAASRAWWCGVPILTEERKTPQKARARIQGSIDLLFGWEGDEVSGHPRVDDVFMAAHDARAMVEQLQRWSVDERVTWVVELAAAAEATIADDNIDPLLLDALEAWVGARDDTRAGALLARHVDRHRGIPIDSWTSMGIAAKLSRIAELATATRLDPAPDPEIRALEDEIRRRRRCGEIWFGVWAPVSTGDWDPHAIADRTTTGLGLGLVGDRWQEISRADAAAMVVHVLRQDMAYATRLMSDEEARALTDRFLALFPEDVQLFGGSLWSSGTLTSGYVAVAGSTFEAGVVAVSRTRAGILWFGDED